MNVFRMAHRLFGVMRMKKVGFVLLLSLLLSGCSIFRTHKLDVVQGNVINDRDVCELRTGMSENQVKDIMGTPLLINLFSGDRIEYVYTYQPGYQKRQVKRVSCIFRHGRLIEIIRSCE